MSDAEPRVFVVDDDDALCDALREFLEAQGLPVEAYNSAEAFLAAGGPGRPGCLVLDVRMRGMSGIELQGRLAAEGFTMPVIVITGHGDVPMAIRAVRNGAVDFLEKPVPDQLLLERIRHALTLDVQRRHAAEERSAAAARLGALTQREHQVMDHVLAGGANKQIAAALGISVKTVEAHRKHVMEKMGVHSVAELMRVVLQTEPPHPAPE
jgi:two-component system response regulator FixJ